MHFRDIIIMHKILIIVHVKILIILIIVYVKIHVLIIVCVCDKFTRMSMHKLISLVLLHERESKAFMIR